MICSREKGDRRFLEIFTCMRCEGYIGEAVRQDEKLFDEMETVREFKYLRYRVSACGGLYAAVTAMARCGWVELRECGELLYVNRFPLKLKGYVH